MTKEEHLMERNKGLTKRLRGLRKHVKQSAAHAAFREMQLVEEINYLKSVMEEVASMPGKDWLEGQLKLGEALNPVGEEPSTVEKIR